MKLAAKDIMNKKVIVISKDASVAELAQLLLRNKIAGVPVTDKDNNIVGMVSETDIITKEADLNVSVSFNYSILKSLESYTKSTKEYLDTKVEDIMSHEVAAIKEDTPISKIASLMINDNVNRVPVVDDNNKLIGIVAREDIIKSMMKKREKK